MTIRRSPLSDLPYWPRFLSIQEAARYVGVSPETFLAEVDQGIWPQPRRRGAKKSRLTWDKAQLDYAADQAAGLSIAAATPAMPDPATEQWERRLSNGAAHIQPS